MTTLSPIHPGEILLTEFLEPMALSQYRVAKDIVLGKRGITAATALRSSSGSIFKTGMTWTQPTTA